MKRGLRLAGVAFVTVGVAGAAFALGSRLAPARPTGQPALPLATAEVTRATLVQTKKVPGTLGYGDPIPVNTRARGTLTWIAPAGSTVARGEVLFKVDEQPVVALYGSVPMYRTLRVSAPAIAKGADVKQLQENLTALGYKGILANGAYTTRTARAVRRWQASLGIPVTGTVEPGQVVFIPGPVRITEPRARVGDPVGDRAGPILAYTGTTRLVTVQLDIADRSLAVVGGMVTLTVPGAGRLDGRIAAVGPIASAAQQQSQGQEGTAATLPNVQLEVTVSIGDQAALGDLDASAVDIDLVSDERRGVLAVPVAALLALPAGGYGVEVVDGGTTRVVPIETGMFAAGLVEVSGPDIAEGVKVGVPG